MENEIYPKIEVALFSKGRSIGVSGVHINGSGVLIITVGAAATAAYIINIFISWYLNVQFFPIFDCANVKHLSGSGWSF